MQDSSLLASSCASQSPALLPQSHSPVECRQVWLDSGASMPYRRMRWPAISSVSPSITLATPMIAPADSAALRRISFLDLMRSPRLIPDNGLLNPSPFDPPEVEPASER